MLNIVCYRFRSMDSDRVNAEIIVQLHESGIAVASATAIGAHTVMRAAIINHRTVASDIDALLDATVAIGRAKTGTWPVEE
jgi:glutamate/tyrosine decarboxylase-like PLP-dependent enzyme